MESGFLSTVFLLLVLADCGAVDEVYKILEQKGSPSWLHTVEMGATTIPENWNGLDKKEDSYNHYSYGAVCDFLFSRTAGIRPDEKQPGYRHFVIQPVPGGTLNYAEAAYESLYGTIRSRWEKCRQKIKFSFTVPINTTAEIILPSGERYQVGSGKWEYEMEIREKSFLGSDL